MDDRRRTSKKWHEVLSQVILVSILAIPMGFVSHLLGMLITWHIYLFWHEALGFDWTAYSTITVHFRRWVEFWHSGLGMHLIYVITYSIPALTKKVKIRYDLLGMLLVAFIFSAVVFDMRALVRGSFVGGDWGYSIAYSFLFAMIMFAMFTLATALLDKHSKMREPPKILLSFGVSGVV